MKILISLLFVWISAFHAQGNSPKKVDVLIVGAGLSGLATAYHMKKAGLSYEILEMTPRVGGRVRTVTYTWPGYEGVRADSGMEEYWESNKAIAFLKELKLPLRSDVAASSMVLESKLEPLKDPKSFFERIFTKDETAQLESVKKDMLPVSKEIKEHKISDKSMKLKDVAFSQWVLDHKISKRVSDWIRISIECEIGTQWDRISALDGIAEFHIFLGNGEKSYRVIGGNEKWVKALADSVGSKNILLNKKVNRIVSHDNSVSVYFTGMDKNTNEVVEAKHVVTTIPLYRFFEVQFEPALSAKKRQAIASQSWGAYFKAHIFVTPKAQKYWTQDKESILPILSDSPLGVIYDGNPDQKGKPKILSLLITGQNAEVFNMMAQDQVRTQITAAFEKLWPGFSKEIKEMEFYRFHPRAIGSWPVGRSRFDDLSNDIRTPENHVYLAGDFTESSHSDGAFLSAERVSEQITALEKGH